MKIALAGNPNSGKTTLFNAITGKTEYVGNWPGVTVEKKEANLKRKYKLLAGLQDMKEAGTGKGDGNRRNQVRVVDLPGAYSIAPYTSEEAVTRDFILAENPDVLLNIVDASNLERSLFFTTQLLELGIPLVVALNKQDVLKRSGNSIQVEGLADALGCPVVETRANGEEGLDELLRAVGQAAAAGASGNPAFEGRGGEGEDKKRQAYVKGIVQTHLQRKRDKTRITTSDRIDRVVANPFLGLPLFGLVMWAVYAFSINGLGGFLADWVNGTLFGELVPDAAHGFFGGLGVHPMLEALIVDGAIAGVGAVLGFLPLILVLFFCLALLEDSGYMARVAVVMDRYFKKIGLSGKSIIPMIVGSGCSIPGVMATRTIEDENEKVATTILTPFIPCSAKLPIIVLFSAVFFPGSTWILPAVYGIAGLAVILGGLLLKRIFPWEESSTFIMELPEYKVPSLRHAFRQMVHQGKGFVVKASTIILVMNTLVWFMQSYGWNLQPAEDQGASILAGVGGLAAPLLLPLGVAGWQMAAAALTGFVAKENVVATFAILFATVSEEALHAPGGVLAENFTPVTGFAFLLFNLFTPPCFAAIGAMNAELGSRKWLARAILFQLAAGYGIGILAAQAGSLLVYGKWAPGAVPAGLVLGGLAALAAVLVQRNRARDAQNELACQE
ncbi:ferrous iron transporter B [Anaerotalea alkaliphila]|uniref:Ferrous iron transporter B n=1 Tax=Anaerotalea alkaliphila TaxID=2662126 RepID=A0A7X5KM07_9FIRM|nr:ferrous iron transporter B [Anaerotalea alkaliphila]NDL66464.1 ferrous iron transporter B [Anaerotalea alkaliphila]